MIIEKKNLKKGECLVCGFDTPWNDKSEFKKYKSYLNFLSLR